MGANADLSRANVAMFNVSVDLSQFRQRVAATKKELERIQRASVNTAAKAGRDEARRGEFKDRTGETRRLLQVTGFSWSGTTAWAEYRTGTPWSWFLELGTNAHEIWPKAAHNADTESLRKGQTRRARGKGPHESAAGRGQALRWKDASGGQIFARHVYHPGTEPLNFMWRSEKTARNVLLRELDKGFAGFRSIWSA